MPKVCDSRVALACRAMRLARRDSISLVQHQASSSNSHNLQSTLKPRCLFVWLVISGLTSSLRHLMVQNIHSSPLHLLNLHAHVHLPHHVLVCFVTA